MTRPIRVLQSLRVMNRAGIETWLMHLLRRFDRREIAMDFLVQTDEAGAYDDEIRMLGARIFPCLKPSQPWRYAWNLRGILTGGERYDIFHSHNYFFAGLDVKVAAHCGVPTRIAHIHPHRDIEASRPFRRQYRDWMCRWIHDYSTCILAPSQASLSAFHEYSGCSDKPAGVVLNCVDLSSFRAPFDRQEARRHLGLPLHVPVVVYVARFVSHKNHLFLAEVARQLEQLGCSVHFAVAGTDGDARPAFERRIAGRADFSVFVNQPDVTPLLRCADIFLFPSTEEGFGTVAIEAAAAGLPVVACDLPAIREACAPSHRRFMFAPGEALSAALKIQSILSEPLLHQVLTGDGIEWAARFSVDHVVDDMTRLYLPELSTTVVCEAIAS